MKSNEYKETKIKNYALWTVQWLLALLFLWAGGVKLVLPLEMLKGPVALPGLFVRFIGVAETLGAIAEEYFPPVPRGSKNLGPTITLLQQK